MSLQWDVQAYDAEGRPSISVTLTATHSTLVFAGSGMELHTPTAVPALRSAPGWGDGAILNKIIVSPRGAILIYSMNGGGNGSKVLTVDALPDGWRLIWNSPTGDAYQLDTPLYGQGELVNQLHPLNAASLHQRPFITWDNGPTGLGNILTPAWVFASGVTLIVSNPDDTLQVGINTSPDEGAPPEWNLWSAAAPANIRPKPVAEVTNPSGALSFTQSGSPLNYRLLVGENAVAAHEQLINLLGKPDRIPPESFLRLPIWTTWAKYKMDISQTTVLQFARDIRAHGFPGGTLEIDDKWTRHYGDSSFDPSRFPDPAGMVRELNALGFNVTTWTMPCFHEDSPNAAEGIERGYFVKDKAGSPYPVLWWQGVGFLLDVSNPDALAWWAGKLRLLKNSVGLAGYKFDAGEANYLPADAVTHARMQRTHYSQRWVHFAATHFPYCEVRSGWFNHREPILFRHWDKFSTWGLDNGLASVITTALALSLSGYPFALPDMIGGNAYGGVDADKELLIRWTQASALMLAIQFSITPWDFDAETVAICKKYADLHVSLAEDRLAAAVEATRSGTPVIRPIWWGDPTNVTAQGIADEYLLGAKYLVAPVVTMGARQRDIYLPNGTWRDYESGKRYEGRTWLRDYPAPLDTLPLFVRVG
ncbi:MAG TPA: glycoside hydrolase family 31 protein [Aggregatilineales bacterium]|nr:glycoside hydrolase family 31 protein [Aggregatilineales bacterium]